MYVLLEVKSSGIKAISQARANYVMNARKAGCITQESDPTRSRKIFAFFSLPRLQGVGLGYSVVVVIVSFSTDNSGRHLVYLLFELG